MLPIDDATADTQAQALAQLAFQLGNPATKGAAGTIFVSTNTAENHLVLQISTNANGVKFTPATPVPEAEAGAADGSLLYLDLTHLQLGEAEFEALTPVAAGWTFARYTAQRQLCLTPIGADVTLDTTTPIQIAVEKFAIANPPAGSTVGLAVTSYHVELVTIGDLGLPVNFKSVLQLPPSGAGDLHEALELSIVAPGVVASSEAFPGVANTLRLVFSPGKNFKAVNAGKETSFTVTFVYGEAGTAGYGALTSAVQAGEFKATRGPGALTWGLTGPKDMQNPAWLLTPPPGPILQPGTGSTAELAIGNIVTDFQPGPTIAIVTYTKVEGYADGAFTIPLQKYGHASVSAFEVTPEESVLVDGRASVKLSWKTTNATSLVLGYKDVTKLSETTEAIGETTSFTLTAHGPEPGGTPNWASKDVEARVLPVVNSFLASPAAVYASELSERSVTLSWNVNTNNQVQLISSSGVSPQQTYNPIDAIQYTPQRPQMLTLVPEGDPEDLLVRRSLILSAFTPAAPVTPALGFDASFVAIAPDTGFVVVSAPGKTELVALDTLVYEPAGSVSVGSKPLGLAFSADGSMLYATASGDGKVLAIEAKLQSTAPVYGMTVKATVAVGGAPQQVAVSPDGLYVYVSIDNGAAAGSLAVLETGPGGKLTLQSTIACGVAPRGVAVSGSGAHVYVANSNDGTVSIIGVGVGGKHSLVGTIRGVGSQPQGLAVSQVGSDGILLVACAGEDAVVAIDTEHYEVAKRKVLAVGTSPQGLALMPGGAYAFVANSGDGTLSMLGIGSTTKSCTVLAGAIPAAQGASQVAVSPDGGLVVAAAPAANGLAVVMLERYAAQHEPVNVGGQPTDVAVSADGAQAAIWNDALTTFHPGTPSTGLYIYDLAATQVQQQLAQLPVIDFAYAGEPNPERGFLITKGQEEVVVVDTATWRPASSFSLHGHTTGSPQRLAHSRDGKTLFVLVGDAHYNFEVVALTVAGGGGALALIGVAPVFTASAATVTGLVAAPDGSAAYALDAVDQTLWILARKGETYEKQPTPVTLPKATIAIALAPDGGRLFAVSRPGSYSVLTAVDLADLSVVTVPLAPIQSTVPNALEVSPDGSMLLLTDNETVGVRVFDAASLRLIQTLSWEQHIVNPLGLAMLPDGSQIFTANVFSNNIGVIQQVQP